MQHNRQQRAKRGEQETITISHACHRQTAQQSVLCPDVWWPHSPSFGKSGEETSVFPSWSCSSALMALRTASNLNSAHPTTWHDDSGTGIAAAYSLFCRPTLSFDARWVLLVGFGLVWFGYTLGPPTINGGFQTRQSLTPSVCKLFQCTPTRGRGSEA